MNISFFTTCVDYSDYFQETLYYNHNLFNKIYVVTTSKDIKTQKLCNQYNNIYIEITDSFYDDGASFNKGKALNTILKYIEPDTWNMIGDVDCIFPKNIHNEIIKNIEFKDYLFTFPRVECKSYEEYIKIKDNLFNNFTMNDMVTVDSIGLGYCQIFNSSSCFLKNGIKYSENYSSADQSDSRFKELWPQRHRYYLDGYIIHLGERRKNWKGRQTRWWSY